MSKLLRRHELFNQLRRQNARFLKKCLVRHYHLEPGEENLCLVAKSYNDLEMEVRTVTHPKENEVQIRVGSCCLSTLDFDYVTRLYGKDSSLYDSVILGSFGTGIVIKTGAGVNEALSEGNRVAIEPGICCNVCKNCVSGMTNLCPNIRYIGSQGLDGVLCRFINHPIAFTHKIDDNVSMDVGTLATKIAGCIHNYKRAGITKESKVLVMGTDLVGLIAIMVIKHLGVGSIFATETSNYRLKLARNFGADYVIKMTSMQSPEYPEYIKEIIHSIHAGEPDIVIDTIGSASSLETSFHLCKSGGRVALMNLMKRTTPTRFFHTTLREISVIGAFSYNHSSFKEAIKLLKSEEIPFNKLLPVKIPLERALDAYSHGRAMGRENLFIIVNGFVENEIIYKTAPLDRFEKTVGVPSETPPIQKKEEKIPFGEIQKTDQGVKEYQDKSLAQSSTILKMENDLQQKENETEKIILTHNTENKVNDDNNKMETKTSKNEHLQQKFDNIQKEETKENIQQKFDNIQKEEAKENIQQKFDNIQNEETKKNIQQNFDNIQKEEAKENIQQKFDNIQNEETKKNIQQNFDNIQKEETKKNIQQKFDNIQKEETKENIQQKFDNIQKDVIKENIQQKIDNIQKEETKENIQQKFDNIQKDVTKENIQQKIDNIQKEETKENIQQKFDNIQKEETKENIQQKFDNIQKEETKENIQQKHPDSSSPSTKEKNNHMKPAKTHISEQNEDNIKKPKNEQSQSGKKDSS